MADTELPDPTRAGPLVDPAGVADLPTEADMRSTMTTDMQMDMATVVPSTLPLLAGDMEDQVATLTTREALLTAADAPAVIWGTTRAWAVVQDLDRAVLVGMLF